MDSDTPQPAKEPVIEMAGVDVAALDAAMDATIQDVNWRVASGDYWVIAGLHNSGKTDLLLTAAALVPPLRGTLRLFGHDVSPAAEDELLADRLRMGLVFDRGARLFHDQTAGENISLPVRYHKNCSEREAENYLSPLIDSLELSAWQLLTPGRVGLKWRQRIGLARALALQPDLLLLDNPVTGLDPKETHWWIETLGRLSQGRHPWMPGKAVTLVVTCDNLRAWKTQARQFGILNDRRWTVVGAREQLTCPDDAVVREFLEAEFAAL